MTLALAFLLLLVTIPVAGGRLSGLERLELRWVWLVALAFAIQVVLVTVAPSGHPTLHRIAHVATYFLAGACILRNLGLRFVFGLALAIWSANAGMKAMIDALNVVYGEEEKRSFVKLNLISLALTLGALGFVLAAVGTVVVFLLF